MIGSISPINFPGNLSNKDRHCLISNEELKNIIIHLETDIADNSWYHKDYSAIDMDIMPALVTQANNKYPEMNLNFVKSPWDIFSEIKKATECEIENFRLIVNMGEDRIYSGVIDCKKNKWENISDIILTIKLYWGRICDIGVQDKNSY